MVAGKSPDWLPPGFSQKIRVKDGRRIKVYTDISTGSKFYSRPAVTRYVSTVSPRITEAERINIDNVDEPISKPDIPVQSKSVNSSGCDSEMKANGKHSFKMVTSEDLSADRIPLGWIKEIRTSKSGKKIRKDYYFIEPSSGYTFSSKIDVLRYLETNDISSCATRPKKRELDEFQMIGNKIDPYTPADEKLSKHCVPGTSNHSGGSSSAKSPEENIKPTQDDNPHSLEDDKSCENSNKGVEMEIIPEPDFKGSETVDPDLPAADSVNEQELASCKVEKQCDDASVRISKSKKTKDPSLPTRASKRLAANLVTSERAVRAAANGPSTSAIQKSLLPGSSLEAAVAQRSKEEAKVEKTHPTLKTAWNNFENHLSESQSEKQVNDGTTPQDELKSCLEFRNSWSDPCLEFAFKTLTEEIPFEETLAFSGRFGDRLCVPSNQSDKCFKPSRSNAPVVLPSEHTKKRGSVDLLLANSVSFATHSGSSSDARSLDFKKLPANGMENRTDKAQENSRKSKKRPNTSERAPGNAGSAFSGPKVNTFLPSFQTAADTPLPFGINPTKEATPLAFHSRETFLKVEKQVVVNKEQEDDRESQLSYARGKSWSDPCLEFAFKTLTSELPIEAHPAYSSRADQYSKQSRSNIRVSFQSEAPHSIPYRVVDHLPANTTSFPTSTGLSSQQEARNKDYLTKVSFGK